MEKKRKMRRVKKIVVTLTEKECDLLTLYAQDCRTTRPAVVRQLVRAGLRDYKARRGDGIVPDNQLDLFDFQQTSIFDFASEAEETFNEGKK